MKRKDWISLVALLIIVGIALIGEQFHATGEWADGTISLLTKLLPLLVFFIIAVYFRNKKGSYVAWFRRISYVTFAISVVFLFILSMPFMHYFNVIGSQEKIATASRQILDDCDVMFKEYEMQIGQRVSKFESDLQTAINQNHEAFLKKEYPTVITYDNRFREQAKDDMTEKVWFANYYVNKDSLVSVKKPQFEGVLIQDFNAFKAASELKELFTLYDRYKKLLSEDFSKTTPFERDEKYSAEFKYQHQEALWKSSKEIFTKMEFNFLWFLLFMVLALFACSSYIFFKDDNVRVPRPRTGAQSIYDKGHNMNNINDDSEID